MRKVLLLLTLALSVTAVPSPVAAHAQSRAAEAAEWKLVVRGTFKALSGKTITYTSSKGTYTARWIGVRRYRLKGTITGRRLTGTIRTHQAESGTRYKARGSGKLGARTVKIRGGGSNNLRTSTLILR